MTKSKRGGQRPGSGRPPLPEEQKLVGVGIMLSLDHIEYAKTQGDGRLGTGVRKIINEHKEAK